MSTNIPLHLLREIASNVMFATTADTPEQALKRIAHASRSLVGAKYAAIGIPDGRGGLRYFHVSGLSDDEIALIEHPPVGEGLLGVIMNEREILRISPMLDDPRASGFPAGHPEMTSLLGVPVEVGEQLYGMLYLTDREDGEPFSLEDQWLIETLAGYVALAIAGGELREKERRLTLLEERQRISMGLHDGVIQSLYAVGMRLELMRTTGKYDVTTIQQTIDGLNDVIEDIRSYILDLKSHTYSEKTIRESINDLVSRLYVPESLKIVIDAPDRPPPFASDIFESVCMVAGEALSNAIRHAEASVINVSCWQTTDSMRIIIEDDGKGFDPDAQRDDDGLGLRNIHERARLHNGAVTIASAPGKGTRLEIRVPLYAR
jgi:signal transduction histidine kinase